MSLPAGTTFAGFRIVRQLGAGLAGEVYLAHHPRLPRLQALRILPAELSVDASFRSRFDFEADRAASLTHPNIVGVHDRGEFSGQLWISMPYIEGINAAQLLHTRYPAGLPRAEGLAIIEAAAEALDYAHQRGLIHGNVKPANLLISTSDRADRRILLADLGIARRLNDGNGFSPAYANYPAPEQLLGRQVDGRADQYALAVSAYELFCGSAPFAYDDPAATIGRQLNSPPSQLAFVRPDLGELDAALSRGLDKEPARRFAHCQEFAAALRGAGFNRSAHIASGPPLRAGAHWPFPGPPPPINRNRHRVLGAAAAVLLVIAMVAVVLVVRTQFGSGRTTPGVSATTSAAASAIVSANDTGPAALITEDTTCQPWEAISGVWRNTTLEHWDRIHPEQDSPLLLPSEQWSIEQRTAMQTSAVTTRVSAVKTESLVRTTPHRLMRELYEQFIAYGRASAAKAERGYRPSDADLGGSAEGAVNVLTAICDLVRDGRVTQRAASVAASAAPSRIAPLQDPAHPQRFVTDSDITTCGAFGQVYEKFLANATVRDWDTHNPGPVDTLSPELTNLSVAVAPLMLGVADDVERAVQSGDNPVMQDFALLFGLYQRVYAKALPDYHSFDSAIGNTARSLLDVLRDSCDAIGT